MLNFISASVRPVLAVTFLLEVPGDITLQNWCGLTVIASLLNLIPLIASPLGSRINAATFYSYPSWYIHIYVGVHINPSKE